MPFSTKVFHLLQEAEGISETHQEFHQSSIFCILCDALYLPKPEKNKEIAKEFERVIKKYLWTQKPHLHEKTLIKALEEAQKHFLKNYAKAHKELKLSALMIIQSPPLDQKTHPFLYIVGLGDFKLFQIDKPGGLIFYDPETPKLPLNLSLKKRFHCLTNAIGQSHARASIQKVSLDSPKSFLLLSYGTYSLIPEDKWLHYTTDFENRKSQLLRSFSKDKERDHVKHLLYLTVQQDTQEEEDNSQSLPQSFLPKPEAKLKKAVHLFNWTFKILILVILGLCILEFTQNASAHSQRSKDTLTRYLHKEPVMRLSLKNSNEKLFKLPLVRERAFVMDLKSKYDRQTLVIEKLNARIREQDKALRDLQIKKFKSLPPSQNEEPF